MFETDAREKSLVMSLTESQTGNRNASLTYRVMQFLLLMLIRLRSLAKIV